MAERDIPTPRWSKAFLGLWSRKQGETRMLKCHLGPRIPNRAHKSRWGHIHSEGLLTKADFCWASNTISSPGSFLICLPRKQTKLHSSWSSQEFLARSLSKTRLGSVLLIWILSTQHITLVSVHSWQNFGESTLRKAALTPSSRHPPVSLDLVWAMEPKDLCSPGEKQCGLPKRETANRVIRRWGVGVAL